MTTERNVQRARGGFTLIELLIVIAIVGILAQIAVPKLGGVLRAWKSKQAAAHVAADLSFARSIALRVGGDVHVVFDGDRRYRIEEGSGTSATVHKSVDLSRDYLGVRLSVPSGVTEIYFDSRGMARVGAGTYVVEMVADGQTSRDRLHLSPLGMVRRE